MIRIQPPRVKSNSPLRFACRATGSKAVSNYGSHTGVHKGYIDL